MPNLHLCSHMVIHHTAGHSRSALEKDNSKPDTKTKGYYHWTLNVDKSALVEVLQPLRQARALPL